MDDFGDELPERRRDDRLVNYRLGKMEESTEQLSATVKSVSQDLTSLRTDINTQFADLKQTLFERPVFVTYELLRVELESRDKVINRLEKADGDAVTTTRHYVSLAVMVMIAVFAPIVINKFWGI